MPASLSTIPARPRLRSASAALAIILAAGCDAAAAPPTTPVAEDPGAIILDVPAEIDEGEAFAVSVTVRGEDGTQPLSSFSGSVQLSVSPATLPRRDAGGATPPTGLKSTVPDSSSSAVFRIVASALSPMPNEGWGVDNVRVTVR